MVGGANEKFHRPPSMNQGIACYAPMNTEKTEVISTGIVSHRSDRRNTNGARR